MCRTARCDDACSMACKYKLLDSTAASCIEFGQSKHRLLASLSGRQDCSPFFISLFFPCMLKQAVSCHGSVLTARRDEVIVWMPLILSVCSHTGGSSHSRQHVDITPAADYECQASAPTFTVGVFASLIFSVCACRRWPTRWTGCQHPSGPSRQSCSAALLMSLSPSQHTHSGSMQAA